ncbi:MAG TPA: preprotein translocase subunit SecG [Candidatus Baltobacteraceae bacterium]|nr:preprotein translocase subunit SecG [Candidatus Baltobacteraceae bacterium]
MDPFLALGQIALSAGVVASILLQSRGAGLGSAFGGDSAVYRSRRGIEKTLYRFTIIITVVWIVFSFAAYALTLSPTTGS